MESADGKQVTGDPKPTASELLSSAKVVAAAAQSALGRDKENMDKAKVARAADDLLEAAAQYGKVEKDKGVGVYVGKAEDYLHKYGSSGEPVKKAEPAHKSDDPPKDQPPPSGDGKSGGGLGGFANVAKEPMFWTMEEDFGMNNNLGTEAAVAVAATAYAIYGLEEGPSSSNDRPRPKRINEDTISVHDWGTKSTSKTIKDRAVSIKEQDTGAITYPAGKGSSSHKPGREVPKQDHVTMKEVPKPHPAATKPARDDLSTIKPVKEVPKPELGTMKPAEEVQKPDLSTTKVPKPDLGRKPWREVSKPDLGMERDVPRPDLSTIKSGRDTASSFKPVEQGVGGEKKPRPISIETAEVADDWEKAEMTRIKQWYDKLNWTISSWEENQKAKARQKLESKERESELRGREKALYKYRRDMEYIEEVVRGARAEAEEKRKRKELRAKEKANLIRTTGKVPMTCFCF